MHLLEQSFYHYFNFYISFENNALYLSSNGAELSLQYVSRSNSNKIN